MAMAGMRRRSGDAEKLELPGLYEYETRGYLYQPRDEGSRSQFTMHDRFDRSTTRKESDTIICKSRQSTSVGRYIVGAGVIWI